LGDDATIQLPAWRSHYVNLETSQLVEQAAQELNRERRRELYENIARIIMDDGPFVFIGSPLNQYGVRTEVADFVTPVETSGLSFPLLK
jgi:ABC-type transport system substrate-binding protein